MAFKVSTRLRYVRRMGPYGSRSPASIRGTHYPYNLEKRRTRSLQWKEEEQLPERSFLARSCLSASAEGSAGSRQIGTFRDVVEADDSVMIRVIAADEYSTS